MRCLPFSTIESATIHYDDRHRGARVLLRQHDWARITHSIRVRKDALRALCLIGAYETAAVDKEHDNRRGGAPISMSGVGRGRPSAGNGLIDGDSPLTRPCGDSPPPTVEREREREGAARADPALDG